MNTIGNLVRQGVRHFDNSEFPEARDRFERALRLDSTDYQVLMNLGFLANRSGQADVAQRYFKKAVSLPDALDAPSKGRGLWALANVLYEEGRYDEAARTARLAAATEQPASPRSLYTVGVFAGLSGASTECCEQIRAAILATSDYFTFAAVDPDLDCCRNDVLQLLSELACGALDAASKAVSGVAHELENVRRKPLARDYSDAISRFEGEVSQLRALLDSPSYFDCVRTAARARELSSILSGTLALDAQYALQAKVTQQAADAAAERECAERRRAWFLPAAGWFLPSAVYWLPGIAFAIVARSVDPSVPVSILIGTSLFWPMFVPFLLSIEMSPAVAAGTPVVAIAAPLVAAFFAARYYVYRKVKACNAVLADRTSLLAQLEQNIKTAIVEIGKRQDAASASRMES